MAKKYFICAVCKKRGNSFLIYLAVVPLHGPASVKLENFAMRANKNKIGAKYIERMTGSKKKRSKENKKTLCIVNIFNGLKLPI